MAEHQAELTSHELYAKLCADARRPAVGVIQGPLQEWRPSRRPLKLQDEMERREFLGKGAPESSFEFRLERGGDGTRTKFSKGFFRRSGVGQQQAAARAAREAEREAHREAHEAARCEKLSEVGAKNGFNVVTGAYDADKLGHSRGRKFLAHEPNPDMVREGERAMRDSAIRFFRVRAEERPADMERSVRLAANGLPQVPRTSAVLGYGRADLPSFGVRDALDKSEYVSPSTVSALANKAATELAAQRTIRATSRATPRGASNEGEVFGGSRRLKPGEREPNRIFEVGTTVIQAAVTDDEKRMIRLDREIAKAVGPRPVDRPKSLLANAAKLQYERERRRLLEEVSAVRELK
jgi:hypothetical protein